MVKLPKCTKIYGQDAAEIVRKTRAPSSCDNVDPEALADDLNFEFYCHMGSVSIDVRSRAKSLKALELVTKRAKALNVALENCDEVAPYLAQGSIALWHNAKKKYDRLLDIIDAPGRRI